MFPHVSSSTTVDEAATVARVVRRENFIGTADKQEIAAVPREPSGLASGAQPGGRELPPSAENVEPVLLETFQITQSPYLETSDGR